ncbi:MAG: EAL domain-containing protein, partial [Gammaproteobacteria bacterium]|nr:EAL domain-containing protein [Gammaproteobacteria bacterium]
EEGYRHFISVEDSTQAVAKLVDTNPDMLLLDLDMPQVDGFQVLQRVRELDDFAHLPIIILTASENPDNKLKALELGATDFLSKPVDPSELALRVRNTLSAKSYQDHLAYYDNLTGLPNRLLFIDQLDKGICQAKRDDRSLVLLDIGLDHFRNINESLGVQCGDQILQTVASRLTRILRGSDIVGRGDASVQIERTARTGGDEFSVVLYGSKSVENASVVSRRVLEAIKQPFSLEGNDLHLTASIGIAVAPDDGDDADTLFKHAVSAKDFAKKQGKDRYQFYSSEMEAHSRALMQMTSDLRAALEKNQFELYYQPQVDAISGRVIGMESLIRWFHPENGLVSPMEFIPVAEEMGLIVPIGEWVLNQACHRASEWNAAGHKDLKVSVNVSANQFKDPGFKDSIVSALLSSSLSPRNLVLEITESMLMGDIDQLADLLREIKSLGVSFSLDDFGTGYSSLSYLKKFPIGELKIDRSFLLEVPANNDDNSIVRAIIAMAHSLGQVVVAEGVEEIEQLEFLRQHDCDIIQGYYYSKPLSQSDFSEYLTSQLEQPRQHQSAAK